LSPRTRIVFWCALAAVLIFGISIRAAHIQDPHRLTPNERAYIYFAGRIDDEGLLKASRALFLEYKNDPDMWAVSQPVRVGYFGLLAAVMKIMGTHSVEAGMTLSFLNSVFYLLLVAWAGLRYFNHWVALIAAALFTTSFMELWLVRGSHQDGPFGLLGFIALLLTCEIMRNPRRWWLHVPFHIVGIWSVLMKQSGVFTYGFCGLVLILFLLFRERALRSAIVVFITCCLGVAAACGILVWLAGDQHTAWRVFRLSFISNDEAWAYQDECCFGGWGQVPWVLFQLSPLTCVLGVLGGAVLLIPGSLTALQKWSGAVCAIMGYGFIGLFSLYPKMQILRYITPGDGAMCLLAGIALWYLLAQARPRLAGLEYAALLAVAAAGIVIGGLRDYRAFDRVAMQAGVPDLGAPLIREALGQ